MLRGGSLKERLPWACWLFSSGSGLPRKVFCRYEGLWVRHTFFSGQKFGGGASMTESVLKSEEASTEVKAIGQNEGDFESIIVDGCLGFSLSIGNAALLVAASMLRIESVLVGGTIAACAAVVAIVLLRCGMVFTDFLQGPTGKKSVLIAHVASFLCAVFFMLVDVSIASGACAAAGIVTTSLLYGEYLVSLVRTALMLLVDIVFMYVGLMLLVISQMDFPFATIALSGTSALSLVISTVLAKRRPCLSETVTAEESKRRSIKSKGNNHTLFLLGFMFAGGLLALFVNVQIDYAVVALGAAIGVAGILSLLARQLDERTYKESLKKSAAFVAALLLLPVPLVPDWMKLLLLSVYMCLVSLNVIVVLNAIVETSCFNMISPVWLFGKEGSVLFAGVALGDALFTVGVVVGQIVDPGVSEYVVLMLAVMLCSYMQIRVNYQVYPFEPVIETKIDDETSAQIEQEGRQKLVWHKKIDVACDQYKLSPREREVLRILLKGRDAKYIMDKFYISQSTAKTHIYNIYRKFSIHSRQELLDFIEDIELPADAEEK